MRRNAIQYKNQQESIFIEQHCFMKNLLEDSIISSAGGEDRKIPPVMSRENLVFEKSDEEPESATLVKRKLTPKAEDKRYETALM